MFRKLRPNLIFLIITIGATILSAMASAFAQPLAPGADATLYLPLVRKPPKSVCPTSSNNSYSSGFALQYDKDDPVRPAYNHADKNLALRGYIANNDPNLIRDLRDYGSDDPTQPPQFATLFQPSRVPGFVGFYRVYDWNWAPSPDPGSRGTPAPNPEVTVMGLQTTPGEVLRVPTSGYDIGGGREVLVIFADEDTVALRYTREDSSGSAGYTVHIDKICTDPNLLARYNEDDDPDGPRYIYDPPSHSYDLPNLPAGKPIGVARGGEVIVAIVDSGTFQDPRSCKEWWQIRPGYSCANE
ncbi:MAG: hypothetical protein PVH03_03395 [Chloroflexota bacterium]|jgi:hypothetical protein